MLTIIPQPKSMKLDESKIFGIDKLAINIADEFSRVKADAQRFIKERTNIILDEQGYGISCAIDGKITEKERYVLQLTQTNATLTAGNEEGLFRGMQTLKQLLVQPLCECCIDDAPRTPKRGFMLDVGRYFYPINDIKQIIEWASIYKLNYFHIHLTEDQGWRFESKKYPLLTQKGSHRSHTNFNCKKEGGFYTQDELKELVAFARERFIEIIPEIDMPGHMVSAIACYKELSCFDRKLDVATHWGVKHDILCGGKEFTYTFCKDILDELCEVFDGEYIHIGGDEAPKFRWDVCPHCQAKIKELGLKNSDELQLHFTNVMAAHLAAKGKKTIMWYLEEELPSILNKDIIQQWWSTNPNEKFAQKIRDGVKIINSNSSSCYIDLPHGRISLNNSYNVPTDLAKDNSESVIGMEACLWTEYVKNLKKAKFNTFPRLCAIAETMWSVDELRDYKLFLAKLDLHKRFLKRYHIYLSSASVYNPHAFRKFCSKVWFEKRQLTWEGLHFIFDDKKVRNLAKKINRKTDKQ